MTNLYHYWDTSQSDDFEQLLILIEAWVTAKNDKCSELAKYHANPNIVMNITDKTLDELVKGNVCSPDNEPSPIKKAACLCFFTAQLRPLRHDKPETEYAELEERVINAQMGFDLACEYLLHSLFRSEDGGVIAYVEARQPPKCPSDHFLHEFVQRLAARIIPISGLCMILELLLYRTNTQIIGIIDENMDERLQDMVEGYDLAALYRHLTAD